MADVTEALLRMPIATRDLLRRSNAIYVRLRMSNSITAHVKLYFTAYVSLQIHITQYGCVSCFSFCLLNLENKPKNLHGASALRIVIAKNHFRHSCPTRMRSIQVQSFLFCSEKKKMQERMSLSFIFSLESTHC